MQYPPSEPGRGRRGCPHETNAGAGGAFGGGGGGRKGGEPAFRREFSLGHRASAGGCSPYEFFQQSTCTRRYGWLKRARIPCPRVACYSCAPSVQHRAWARPLSDFAPKKSKERIASPAESEVEGLL